jgi:hypothetical protein
MWGSGWFDETERGGIDAVPQAGRIGAIVENVSEMRFAAAACYSRPHHPESLIFRSVDVFARYRLPETGPTGAGVELGCGGKQSGVATNASIQAVIMKIPVRARVRKLGRRSPGHLEGRFCQQVAPGAVALQHLRHLMGVADLARFGNIYNGYDLGRTWRRVITFGRKPFAIEPHAESGQAWDGDREEYPPVHGPYSIRNRADRVKFPVRNVK